MIRTRIILIGGAAVVIAITLMPACLRSQAFQPTLANVPLDPPNPEDRIAFASKRDGNWEIYAVRPDGSQLARLTTLASQDRMPIWSPDGRKIAFESQINGPIDDSSKWQLWVMDADGSHLKNLITNIVAKGSRQWSPDGARILFETERDGNGEIYTIGADGSRLTRLTNNEVDDWSPTWSPDGKKMMDQSPGQRMERGWRSSRREPELMRCI